MQQLHQRELYEINKKLVKSTKTYFKDDWKVLQKNKRSRPLVTLFTACMIRERMIRQMSLPGSRSRFVNEVLDELVKGRGHADDLRRTKKYFQSFYEKNEIERFFRYFVATVTIRKRSLCRLEHCWRILKSMFDM